MSIQADTLYQQLLTAVAPTVVKHFLEQAEKDLKKTSQYDPDYERIADVSHQVAMALYKKSADLGQRS